MKLSPQSDAVITQLLAGETAKKGKVAVGPLDETAQVLLKVLVKHSDELGSLKGEVRASKLRDWFVALKNLKAEAAAKPGAALPHFIVCPTPPKWRLLHLRCLSIRGVAPPGEQFQFDFQEQSNLVYGPNGSGKSSLLGAIIWVLTGETIVDATTSLTEAPLYKPTDDSKTGTKLRDWPIVATLPTTGDVTKATIQSWGELVLKRDSDGQCIQLRRTHGTVLAASSDGQNWTTIENLNQIGVGPLDLQLSVIAPTIFGRRCIEEAEHTRNILGLMLGFDDLEQLGELASQISGNRTRLANTEKGDIERKVSALRRLA